MKDLRPLPPPGQGRSRRRAASALAVTALVALALATAGTGTALAAPASRPAPAAIRAAAGPPSTTGGSSGLGMMPGTSPSIAPMDDGGYRVAYQDTAGNLAVAWPGGHLEGRPMMAGTSPSIAEFATDSDYPQGSYIVAYQTPNAELETLNGGPGGTTENDWGSGLMAGTSPSIAVVGTTANGHQRWEAAAQDNTGDLVTVGQLGSKGWNLGMMAGTSPAITGLHRGDGEISYAVAFQANTGDLWTLRNSYLDGISGTDWGLGMMAGTSPAITGFDNDPDGYEVAIQANTGQLWTARHNEFLQSDTHTDRLLGMKAGTSPAISQLHDGLSDEVAFQANTGDLWTCNPDGSTNDSKAKMNDGTSPAVTRLAYGGYQVATAADTGDLTVGTGLLRSSPAPLGKAKATQHNKRGGTPATCDSSLAYTGSTWMGDLASCLQNQKLADIVMPGSHDTTTFGLGCCFDLHDLWHTQELWTSTQADYGARQFDIRVELNHQQSDWNGYHGSGFTGAISSWLTLQVIFSDIATWAHTPGHEHEVLLVNLTMRNGTNGNATNDVAACQWFGQQMGDALVTPSQFAGSFGTTDPGQLTLNQLWSLPDPNHSARVIIDNAQCTGDAQLDAGTWTPSSGYYADQCTASGTGSGDQKDGITEQVLQAVKGRNNNEIGGEPSALGPPAAGGYYVLFIQGTPEADCLTAPWDMVGDEKTVLQALYSQWQTDSATRNNLNIVSGDYIEDNTSLLPDVIAMNEAKFAAVPSSRPSPRAGRS